MLVQTEEQTGYPSIDKPWLKYYEKDVLNKPLPECSVYDYMYLNNKDHTDDIALEYFGKEISYGELIGRIHEAAKAFSALGVKQGDYVSFCTITTPETIVAFYALNRLGAAANLIDPRTNAEKIEEYVASVKSKIVIVLDIAYPKVRNIVQNTSVEKLIMVSVADSMPFVIKWGYYLTQGRKTPKWSGISTNISWKDFIDYGRSDQKLSEAVYRPDMPAAVVYTGGTTGVPKGAVLSNDALNTMVILQKYSNTRMERGHKFLGFMPPFIAYGLVCGITNPLSLGLRIIIIPRFDPEKFDELLKKHKPNHAIGVPSYWESLAKSKNMHGMDLSFIENAITGGDRIDPSSEQMINQFFYDHGCKYRLSKGYGMTEFSSTATYSVCDDCNLPGSVGIPLFRNNVKIVVPGTQKELPYNQPGEICMTSPTMMLGYYGNEAETEKTLVKHEDGLTWIHTQDIGYVNEDGVIFVIDRLKRMIVRHDGFKVFPSKIESVISRCDHVQDCAVVGVTDQEHHQGQNPIAFIVLKKDWKGTEQEAEELVRHICEEELPEYSIPSAYRMIREIPLTPIGKVDYRTLEQIAETDNKAE